MTAPAIELERLGWDDAWREAAQPFAQHGSPGRVARVDRGLCTLWGADGPVRASFGSSVLEAVAADPLQAPCTGDWGVVRRWPDGPITLETVLPRRTAVIRAEASGSSRGQVLASNVEVAAVVVALHPEPNLARLERLLSLAWASGARPIVVLTKADLVTDTDLILDDIASLAPEVLTIATSTVTDAGFDVLRGLVADGATMALLGASGQGKSSLVNQLVGAKTLATRRIRDDGKGRHTSVRRELVLLPSGGSVIDTPGLRGVGLQASGGGVDAAFPDLVILAEQCRFADCNHTTEPGCAVLEAVADGRLPERRLNSWRVLHIEGADMTAREAERARWQAGKRSKFESKQQKAQQRALRRGQLK